MRASAFGCWLLVGVLAGLVSPLAYPAPTAEVPGETDAQEIQAAPTTSSGRLEKLYERARNSLEAQASYQAKLESLQKNALHRPLTLTTLQKEIAAVERSRTTPPVSQRERTLDTVALENLVELTRAERVTLEGKLASYELKLRALAVRPEGIAKEKAAAEARLTNLEAERVNVGKGLSDPLSRAQANADEAELRAGEIEIEMLNLEQANLVGATEIANLRRDLALLNLESLSARIAALDELLIEHREASALGFQKTAELAQTEAQGTHPLAQALASETQLLSEELAALVQLQATTVRRRAEYAENKQRISTEYETSKQRLQIAGTSAILGRILVGQRRQLPRLNTLAQSTKLNAEEVSRVSLRRIELEEKQRALQVASADPAKFILTEIEAGTAEPQLIAQIRGLVTGQAGMVRTLDTNYAAYLREIDTTESELVQLTKAVAIYAELLDQRLLWIPNAAPWSLVVIKGAAAVCAELLVIEPWRRVVDDLRTALVTNVMRSVGFVMLVVLVYGVRRQLLRYVNALAISQQQPVLRRVRDTLAALVATVVIALPVPLMLAGFGLALAASPGASTLALALSQTLQFAAGLSLVTGWWLGALSDRGVIRAHFGAEMTATRQSRAAWNIFMQAFVPTYSLALFFEWPDGAASQNDLARILFVVAMLSLVGFTYWLLRKKGPLSKLIFGLTLERWRPLWKIAVGWPPLIFAGLSAVGYHYTALELSKNYLLSGLLIALGILLYQLALRWISNARHRLQASNLVQDSANQALVGDASEVEKFNIQVRLIARNAIGWSLALGLLAVWQTVLPALTILDGISLWEIVVDNPNGGTTLQAVTVASVALASVIGLVTLVAARNLPGVFEVGLLQRIGVDRGSRYALSSLSQYAIIAIGFSFVLSTLGVRWSQVQWLVAALGVGLGFGLQEIFANFVSGLILLFERPIRVGDVVTIDEMTGTVAQIRIRATTITDSDNKEIVVPNKKFITDRFVNWTLSDQVTRIVLKVGIAYGADIEQASRLLIDLAKAHPRVMRDPAPQVVLTGFGESALALELQVYAEELSHRSDVRHVLNSEIYRVFSAHGIEMPFPQRDLHIRSVTRAEDLLGTTVTASLSAQSPNSSSATVRI
jgi:potassium-dependent mechanosensitive channel